MGGCPTAIPTTRAAGRRRRTELCSSVLVHRAEPEARRWAGVCSIAQSMVLVFGSGGCKTFWSSMWFFSSLPWDGACPDLILERSQELSCGNDPYLRAEKHRVRDISCLIKIWSEPS